MNAHDLNPYPLPPVVSKSDGDPRRVGFELEFSGIDMVQVIDALQRAMRGEISAQTVAETKLFVDGLGEFNVELDWQYLKRRAAEAGNDVNEQKLLEFVSQAAALLVPIEVVCPPIVMRDLDRLDGMVESLREAGAVGTEESLIAAYGVHINSEIPALDSNTLQRYLQAYALLQWWLVDAHDVDPARRLSPYIDLYPEAYLHLILSRTEPDMTQIFDDYLEHNNTRNRALDLMPILKEIDPERIEREVDDPRIKARPAFHYRMPNCNIECSDWSLASSWSKWLVVERLADSPDHLASLAKDFAAARRPILGVHRDEWVEYLHQWLLDRELV